MAGVAVVCGYGQSIPGTAGETLSGRPMVLAEAVRAHAAVLVFGFTKEASDGCGEWAKALREDPAMAGVGVLQVAELEAAPGFMRPMIRSAMRKGVSAAEQDRFVVLTKDDKAWREWFGVTADKEPYVALLDGSGKVLWHGHGAASGLEPLLRAAMK